MKVDFNSPAPKDTRYLPMGVTLVGRVCEDDGSCPGALVKLASGDYARANQGHMGRLDQQAVIDALERAKSDPGARSMIGTSVRPYNMMLSDSVAQTLRMYGGGNLTAGVRKAAELVRVCGVSV